MSTQFVDLEEGRLAYTDYGGTGQLVLMLPGMGALRSEYRFLGPMLAGAGFRAFAADLRGHGESSVPWTDYDVASVGDDILDLITRLGEAGGHVICTSKSAGAGVWAAAERPESIRSLVLIAPFAREVRVNPIMGALFWVMMNGPWRVRAWLSYYASIYPTRKPPDFEDYIEQLARNLREPGRFDAVKDFGEAPSRPSEERLGRVKAPGLVLMGTKDPDFPDPVGEGRAVAEAMGGELIQIEGAGHYPQTETPETTGPIVVDFLRRSVSLQDKAA